MNRLIFSTLFFYLCGPSFAAERMNASSLGNGYLAEGFSYSRSNFASVLFKATPTGRSSGRLMYAYQGDNPDTTRKSAAGLRTALKLLGGTVGGIGAFIFHASSFGIEWCDDNIRDEENCGKAKSIRERSVAVLSISLCIATGVSVWDPRDRFVYTLAGSLLGFGVSAAIIDRGWEDFGLPLLIPFFPVIAATAASEWSRDRSESRRYSLGLRPEPKGGLSVVAALRF